MVNTKPLEPEASEPSTYGSGDIKDAARIPLPNPVRPSATAENVPAHLHQLFGWGEAGGYLPRSRMVRKLGRNLPAAEVDALIAFLYLKPTETGLSDSDFNGVGDVVMEKLEAQETIHPDYTDHLVVIHYDRSYSEVWRDYCLQHIGSTYKRMASAKLPVIRQLYEDSLKPDSGMSGVALLAMKNSLGGAGMSESYVSGKALIVASDPAHPDSSRLSALLVAAELKNPGALELARDVVGSKKHTAHFRTASIAAIGLMGDVSDLPMLGRYSGSSDIRFRESSKAALANIQKRQRL